MAGGSITATWTGKYSRTPTAYAAGPPPLAPLAVPVANTPGQWLFAIVSWRQDAGVVGTLQYPSTCTVSDDAGNFWIPVEVVPEGSGIVRTAVWMAPAARAAEFVFVSPTAYQSALTVLIAEVTADCPWYQVAAVASNWTNQGGSITLSQDPASGLFSIGAIAYDLSSATVTPTASGWTATTTVSTTNGSDHSGDLEQLAWTATSAGSSMTISASATAPASMTVTATATGGTANGITLGLRVLTGAQNSAAQVANARLNAVGFSYTGGSGLPQGTIQPNAARSFLYASLIVGATHTAFTPVAGSTFVANTPDATNNVTYGIVKPAFPTSVLSPPVTVGASAPSGGSIVTLGAIAEILSATGIVEDGSTPAVITNTAGHAVTTAGFSPPAGSLLLAEISSNAASAMTMTIADSSGLTWYKLITSATGQDNATLWVADVPSLDFSEVLIAVHGVTDTIAFPYTVPDVGNWPVLVTEIAAGPVLNANPVIVNGTTDWTAAGGTLAAVTWPVYQPWPAYQAIITPSLSLTPSGSATTASVTSELEAVSATTLYTAVAYVYSAAGFGGSSGSCYAGISWYTSGLSLISTTQGAATQVPAAAWTQLTFSEPVNPPATAAFGAVTVVEAAASGDVSSSAILFIGYAGFGPADSYEDVPADQTAWTDLSARNFTQDSISITRGIQYEQQSLEAGTMKVNLANNDGQMMFGNILSSYWPTIGDTDVPIRLRAIWQQSVTPYYVLFSGFTDQIEFGWSTEDGTWYGYASFEASDAWSRLTSQMLAAAQQEILEDNPGGLWPCSLSGTNIAPGAVTPVVTLSSAAGPGGASAGFGGSAINLAGDSGDTCWQSSGNTGTGLQGVALTYFPPSSSPLPSVSRGMTVAFWESAAFQGVTQPSTNLTLCTCWSAIGPMWTLTLNGVSGPTGGYAFITVYDKTTGTGTTTQVGTVNYLASLVVGVPFQFAVSFTQSSLTVVISASDGGNQSTVTVTANLAATAIGLSWGGNAGPLYANNLGGTPGFMNLAIALPAYFPGIVPPARIAAQNQTALNAWAGQTGGSSQGEIDTTRLARVAGYAGATPVVLGMRCLDLPVPPGPDLDQVTAVTDTSGQVTSGYFTNIAASTLAAMFVNGPGVLIYRRRLEWYNRPSPQWVLGELAPYPVNANSSFTNGTAGWSTANGASLSATSIANGGNAGPWFVTCGLFAGNGVTAGPSITYGSAAATPATPGDWYSVSTLLYSPQGWSTGVTLSLQFYTSGASLISTVTTPVTPLGTASLLYLTTGAAQAPATAAYATFTIAASGTPGLVGFYVTDVVYTPVGTVTAGGAGATAPETPYLDTAKLSSDRALLFNQAILTQYGTSTATKYSGASIVFSPTSGVTVLAQNNASVTARAGVPYTATLYLLNTVQALPYYLNEPSMEDFGNWITQTLASPLMRPETVTITPAATPEAMLTALGTEIGDTSTFRRRPQTGGAPEIQVLTYVSKLTHTIKIDTPTPWQTQYELSPFPVGVALQCDSVINGTLTGGNLLGW